MYNRYCKLRDEKGYKDADISRLTGISRPTLSDWKRGVSKPKQDKLIKIAECLGVTTDYLLTGEEKQSEFSPEQAELDLRISQDIELKEALKKYFSLSNTKKKHIIEMIELLSKED